MVDEDRVTSRYEPRIVRSVAHAAQLLRHLADGGSPATLSNLSRKIGLSKPAVYNLMSSLIAEGLVSRDEVGGYRLGWTTFELATRVEAAQRIARAGREPMRRLATSVAGAILLSVPDRDHVLYVDRRQADPNFQTIAAVGRRSPLHATASGKALLAYASDRQLATVLSGPLPASTTTTIVDPASLAREIHRVREHGYAMCWGEREPMLSSVAVPVLGPAGQTLAALAVATSTERLRKGSPGRLVDRLRGAADELSRAIIAPEAFAIR